SRRDMSIERLNFILDTPGCNQDGGISDCNHDTVKAKNPFLPVTNTSREEKRPCRINQTGPLSASSGAQLTW
ncbi:MAG: hypothetical protein ACKVH7_16450, partial [Alphaproteobacteria bacterium]